MIARTSAICASIAGSSASAAAIPVSIAVRHRTPSAIAACRISAASRTAPERGVGRVDDEPHVAVGDRLEDRPLPDLLVGRRAELRDRLHAEPRLAERRARPGRRREPVAGAAERLGQRDEPPLVAIRDRQQRERRLAVARAAAGTSDAPVSALAIATRGSSAIPMTSPVDCMNGPTDGSTPLSFAVENAGALTATNGGGGRSPGSQPRSASVAPSPIRTASSTIGTPVTLDRNGTVRLARGLTSIRYTPSSRTMNCALTRPLAPSARQIRSIVCTIRSTSPSDTCCGGNTAIESPEWTPARSTCSSRPGMRTPMPSHTASMSTSMPSRKRSMRTGRSGSTMAAAARWRTRSSGEYAKSMASPPMTNDGRTMTG